MPRRNLTICSSPIHADTVPVVGKYWLPRRAGCESGWFGVCERCAEEFQDVCSIEFYDDRQADEGDPNCDHVWVKKNLVTNDDFTDTMVCQCGATAKRRALGDI